MREDSQPISNSENDHFQESIEEAIGFLKSLQRDHKALIPKGKLSMPEKKILLKILDELRENNSSDPKTFYKKIEKQIHAKEMRVELVASLERSLLQILRKGIPKISQDFVAPARTEPSTQDQAEHTQRLLKKALLAIFTHASLSDFTLREVQRYHTLKDIIDEIDTKKKKIEELKYFCSTYSEEKASDTFRQFLQNIRQSLVVFGQEKPLPPEKIIRIEPSKAPSKVLADPYRVIVNEKPDLPKVTVTRGPLPPNENAVEYRYGHGGASDLPKIATSEIESIDTSHIPPDGFIPPNLPFEEPANEANLDITATNPYFKAVKRLETPIASPVEPQEQKSETEVPPTSDFATFLKTVKTVLRPSPPEPPSLEEEPTDDHDRYEFIPHLSPTPKEPPPPSSHGEMETEIAEESLERPPENINPTLPVQTSTKKPFAQMTREELLAQASQEHTDFDLSFDEEGIPKHEPEAKQPEPEVQDRPTRTLSLETLAGSKELDPLPNGSKVNYFGKLDEEGMPDGSGMLKIEGSPYNRIIRGEFEHGKMLHQDSISIQYDLAIGHTKVTTSGAVDENYLTHGEHSRAEIHSLADRSTFVGTIEHGIPTHGTLTFLSLEETPTLSYQGPVDKNFSPITDRGVWKTLSTDTFGPETAETTVLYSPEEAATFQLTSDKEDELPKIPTFSEPEGLETSQKIFFKPLLETQTLLIEKMKGAKKEEKERIKNYELPILKTFFDIITDVSYTSETERETDLETYCDTAEYYLIENFEYALSDSSEIFDLLKRIRQSISNLKEKRPTEKIEPIPQPPQRKENLDFTETISTLTKSIDEKFPDLSQHIFDSVIEIFASYPKEVPQDTEIQDLSAVLSIVNSIGQEDLSHELIQQLCIEVKKYYEGSLAGKAGTFTFIEHLKQMLEDYLPPQSEEPDMLDPMDNSVPFQENPQDINLPPKPLPLFSKPPREEPIQEPSIIIEDPAMAEQTVQSDISLAEHREQQKIQTQLKERVTKILEFENKKREPLPRLDLSSDDLFQLFGINILPNENNLLGAIANGRGTLEKLLVNQGITIADIYWAFETKPPLFAILPKARSRETHRKKVLSSAEAKEWYTLDVLLHHIKELASK